jgi:intraflagellar transport protein 172
VREFKDNYF